MAELPMPGATASPPSPRQSVHQCRKVLGSRALYQSILAIIAPSGTDWPFAGMPTLNALIITGFPTIDLMHPGSGDEPQPPASSVTDEPITPYVS
jgi:hypothetical protein